MKNQNLELAGVNYFLNMAKQANRLTESILEDLKMYSGKVQAAEADSPELKEAVSILTHETLRVIDMLIMLNDTALAQVDLTESDLMDAAKGKEL
ncbi:hypothetical protein [Jeotgalibaca porci]|uniref:hypothetical protein n=1 Tax=Jeotgalibaca porci TaxID=1868793 RepID=UPI0035A07108